LTSGEATGPLVVNQLIDELQARGATNVRRPRCAHCGHVKPVPYRADGRYICRNCATKQRCANCGRISHAWYRDRNGQPRCRACRPDPGTDDPVADICTIVTRVDPDLNPHLVRQVVLDTVARRHHLLQLYWKLDAHPEWLTGHGGDGSQHVTALIEGLRQAGSRKVSPPPCPRCGHVRPLSRRIDGEGVCLLLRDNGRDLRPVPSAPPGRGTRPGPRTAVPTLLGKPPDEPRDMCQVRATPRGTRTRTGRTAILQQLLPVADSDLFDLRPRTPLLPEHYIGTPVRVVLRHTQTLRTLRRNKADRRPLPRRTALRTLLPTRPRIIPTMHELRHCRTTAPPRPVRAMRL